MPIDDNIGRYWCSLRNWDRQGIGIMKRNESKFEFAFIFRTKKVKKLPQSWPLNCIKNLKFATFFPYRHCIRGKLILIKFRLFARKIYKQCAKKHATRNRWDILFVINMYAPQNEILVHAWFYSRKMRGPVIPEQLGWLMATSILPHCEGS